MLSYNLDISADSYMHVYTPDTSAAKFPFCIYENGYFEAGKDYFTVRDNKPMYLLIYTISGCGIVKAGGKLRYVSAGNAVLLDCRKFHEYKTASEEKWCFHWVHFDGPCMEGYASVLSDDLVVVELNEKLKMNRYFEDVRALSAEVNGVLKYSHTSGVVSGMLFLMMESKLSSFEMGYSGRDVVGVACTYIEKNLGNDITIDMITAEIHLSKYYFIRLFKQYMGVSPYKYVQICRVNKAKELLVTTDCRINEISDSVGFANPARFTKLFCEMTGLTPSKFRKNSFNMKQSAD